MKNWSHKVVKMSRGLQGEWFAHRAAITGTEAECLAYAERFAADQRAVLGAGNAHKILVVARKGGDVVQTFRV